MIDICTIIKKIGSAKEQLALKIKNCFAWTLLVLEFKAPDLFYLSLLYYIAFSPVDNYAMVRHNL